MAHRQIATEQPVVLAHPIASFTQDRILAVVSLVAAVSCALPLAAHADEGGVPFWFSGQYASMAALPATPGWTLALMGYDYQGDAAVSKSLGKSGSAALNVDTSLPMVYAQPTYSPQSTVFDGQLSLGVGFGYAKNTTSADVSLSAFDLSASRSRSDTEYGGTDLYPIASLAWSAGVHNWMTYFTGDVPVGAYDSERLANLGIGHAAVDAGGGYTYLNEQTGRELSAVLGVTYNFENPDTHYRNGNDGHLDWAASQFLSEHWQVGMVGYVYHQLSGDSGAGARFGEFKSKVSALGPEIGYVFAVDGKPAYVNLRGYWESDAQNRVEGHALYALLVLPIGSE